MTEAPILSISHVAKSFDGTFALSDVTFDIYEGECLALVGENGAGKSTLMKILSGVWPYGTYKGEIFFKGKPIRLTSTLEGRRSGISIIHQELCLFPKLTVAENLFLTEGYPYSGEPSVQLFQRVHWEELYRKAEDLFKELNFQVDARALVEELSVAQRQLVEIAKAFHQQAKVLILDEPTSALSQVEVEHLFQVIQRMRKRMTFIYISHKLDEVFTLADRIVVLRDGRAVASLDKKTANAKIVIHHMVGRPLKETARQTSVKTGSVVFQVERLSHADDSGRKVLEDISFDVKPGEIFGVAGLMGSGRSELLRSILGVLPGTREGKIFLNDKPVRWQSAREAMADGMAFVPEDRKKDGLFLDHGIDFNLTISILDKLKGPLGALDLIREKSESENLTKKMGVRFRSLKAPVKVLSGGNQQKVLLAKMVALNPKVLLLDEPTRGIDVGAKEEIYEIIRRLACEGISVILVSSELPEILALSDRVLVLREGRAMGQLVNENLTQEKVMAFAAGTAGEVHGSC
jgi:D-xylose transport system ATP-binding protein